MLTVVVELVFALRIILIDIILLPHVILLNVRFRRTRVTYLPWDFSLAHVVELGADLDTLVFLIVILVLVGCLTISRMP